MPIARVKNLHISAARAFEKIGTLVGRTVGFVITRGRHEDNGRISSAGKLDKTAEDQRIQFAAANHDERTRGRAHTRAERRCGGQRNQRTPRDRQAIFSAMDFAWRNWSKYSGPPAFESVPDMLNPPNGCAP